MPVAVASLTLVQCFASHSISVYGFDCFIIEKKLMYSHTFSGLTFRGSLQSRTPFLLQIFIKRRYVCSN